MRVLSSCQTQNYALRSGFVSLFFWLNVMPAFAKIYLNDQAKSYCDSLVTHTALNSYPVQELTHFKKFGTSFYIWHDKLSSVNYEYYTDGSLRDDRDFIEENNGMDCDLGLENDVDIDVAYETSTIDNTCTKNENNVFLFADYDIEATFLEYKKKFARSKIFLFSPTLSGVYNINLFSKTRNYYPQLSISYVNKDSGPKYAEVDRLSSRNGSDEINYQLYNNIEYIVEIGSIPSLHTYPFLSVPYGQFICLIGIGIPSLQETLMKHQYWIKYNRIKTKVPVVNGEPIDFEKTARRNEKNRPKRSAVMGYLDFKLTPYFNMKSNSISLFYHFPEDNARKFEKSAIVEFICSKSQKAEGKNLAKRVKYSVIKFKVKSRDICKILEFLNK